MKLLLVDDEEMNLEILTEVLVSEGYDVVTAVNGVDALNVIHSSNDNFDVILLDRMMPKMDGMEFIEHLKRIDSYKDVPVIMQTAAANPENIVTGVSAGVFYYLIKPFKSEVLLSVVRAAYDHSVVLKKLKHEVVKNSYGMRMLRQAKFKLKTIEEAKNLTYLLCDAFPAPDKILLGLSEIIINAVEHGNLEIGYDLKGDLLRNGTLSAEVEKRLSMPKYKDRFVEVEFERTDDEIILTVTDCGNGFDWLQYSDMEAERASDPNGRGILMAKMMSFDQLEYQGSGNRVVCKIKIK